MAHNSRYSCVSCDFNTNRSNDFKRHLVSKKHLLGLKYYVCYECRLICKTKQHLRQHRKTDKHKYDMGILEKRKYDKRVSDISCSISFYDKLIKKYKEIKYNTPTCNKKSPKKKFKIIPSDDKICINKIWYNQQDITKRIEYYFKYKKLRKNTILSRKIKEFYKSIMQYYNKKYIIFDYWRMNYHDELKKNKIFLDYLIKHNYIKF